MKLTLTIILLAACCASALAGKIVSDPNVGERVRPRDSVDLRLAQKITYETKFKSVRRVLEDLSRISGVKMRAGWNNQDWQVRDRRMNIFAKDLPLKDLMDSIARVMKFKWLKRKATDPPSYLLYMDRKSVLSAENRQLDAETKRDEWRAKKRQEVLDKLLNTDKLSPKQLEDLRKTDPWLLFYIKTGVAKSLTDLVRAVPAIGDALRSASVRDFRYSAIGPEGRQAMVKSAQDMSKWITLMHDYKEPFMKEWYLPEQEMTKDIGDPRVWTGLITDLWKNTSGSELSFDDIGWGFDNGNAVKIEFLDPDSKSMHYFGELGLRCLEQNKAVKDVQTNFDYQGAMSSDLKTRDLGEAEVKHADDPDLHAKVKLDLDKDKRRPELPEVEEAIHKASGFAVVSDCFGMTHASFDGGRPDKDIELVDLLNKLGKGSGYNWWKNGRVLEFRDRNWFRKRGMEIPEEWLERWKSTLKKTGTLDIGDLSQMATLTLEQYYANIVWSPDNDYVLMPTSSAMGVARDLLRLYSVMSETQRSLVFAAGGLDLDLLTADQAEYADRMIPRGKGLVLSDDQTKLFLVGVKTPKDKQFEYKFTVATPYGPTSVGWTFTTPKYEPPKEKPKDEKKIDKPADTKK